MPKATWNRTSRVRVGCGTFLEQQEYAAITGTHRTQSRLVGDAFLLISGLFRYVRNPMYVAVIALILGQGLFFGSVAVLAYGVAVWLGFYLFVLIYEEPTLRNTYGLEYEEFCANVPRWIPRLRPWRRQAPGQ